MKEQILNYLKELDMDLYVSENEYAFELGIIEGICPFVVAYIERDSNIDTMEDFKNSIIHIYKNVFESNFIQYQRNKKLKQLGI